jgi:hypothetical protein
LYSIAIKDLLTLNFISFLIKNSNLVNVEYTRKRASLKSSKKIIKNNGNQNTVKLNILNVYLNIQIVYLNDLKLYKIK